jgi:hypothetical protein
MTTRKGFYYFLVVVGGMVVRGLDLARAFLLCNRQSLDDDWQEGEEQKLMIQYDKSTRVRKPAVQRLGRMGLA